MEKVHERKSERHDRVPVNPNTGKLIHSVCLRNDSAISILVDAFGENALQYSKKKKARQCECVIYPDNYKDTDWVLFVEMKYAENEIAAFRKENDYPNNMIEQIKQTGCMLRKPEKAMSESWSSSSARRFFMIIVFAFKKVRSRSYQSLKR